MAAYTHPVFELKFYTPSIDQVNPWIEQAPYPTKSANVPFGPYWARPVPKSEQTYFGSCIAKGSYESVSNYCNPANGMRPVIEKSETTSTYQCVCKNDWGQYGCNNEPFSYC